MSDYDLGHTSMVRMIRAAHRLFDVGSIGLLRMAGEEIAVNTELDQVDVNAVEVQPGIIALPVCPFAGTIKNFTSCCGKLPEELYELADHANSNGEAWVSAFCGIHQSFRKTKIGDSYQQIGCRSGDKIVIADQDLMTEEEAREVLKDKACVYAK